MNLHVLNASLLIGWLMVLVGGCLANLAFGLIGGGVLLLVLTALAARIAGIATSRG